MKAKLKITMELTYKEIHKLMSALKFSEESSAEPSEERRLYNQLEKCLKALDAFVK